MKNLIIRFLSETPIFWRKVQRVAASLCTVLIAVWVTNTHLELELDAMIVKLLSHGIAVCIAITGVAQFTIKDIK